MHRAYTEKCPFSRKKCADKKAETKCDEEEGECSKVHLKIYDSITQQDTAEIRVVSAENKVNGAPLETFPSLFAAHSILEKSHNSGVKRPQKLEFLR